MAGFLLYKIFLMGRKAKSQFVKVPRMMLFYSTLALSKIREKVCGEK